MSAPAAARPAFALAAAGCLVALIALSIAWELWLAPLRPGGSALMLKAVPLALMLPGVWRRSVYTLQWASMLILLYVAEGVVRGMTDGGLSARLGWLELLLAAGSSRPRWPMWRPSSERRSKRPDRARHPPKRRLEPPPQGRRKACTGRRQYQIRAAPPLMPRPSPSRLPR